VALQKYYRGNYRPDEVLLWYKERDSIEKMFLSLKSYLRSRPLSVQSMETLNALFFIGLILRHRLLRMILEKG